MQHYAKLQVWRRSHKLVLALYQSTKAFPNDERNGLTAQLRRAVASVPTNIAEGSKRARPKDYAHFLNMAEVSLSGTEYLVFLSKDLGYIRANVASAYLAEISELLRMLNAFRKTVLSDSESLTQPHVGSKL